MHPRTLLTTHGDLATALLTALESREVRARDAIERWRQWGQDPRLPRQSLAASLSDALKDSDALRAAKAITRRADDGSIEYVRGTWVLAGPVGTGKTLAAARWAFAHRAHWITACDLGLAPPFQAREELRELRARRSLVIDELGGPGSTSPSAVERLGALIALRHSDGLATLITTNLDQRAFAATYDGVDAPAKSRLIDRVRERGAWFDCGGQSLRGMATAPVVDGDPPRILEAKRLARLCDRLRDIEREPRDGARVGAPVPTEIEAAFRYVADAGGDPDLIVAKVLDARAAMLGQADELLEQWRAEGLEVEGDGVDAIVGGLLASKGGR